MWNVLVNPSAKNKRASKISMKVSKYFKSKEIPFYAYFSEREGMIRDMASDLTKKGEKDFIIIGGADTINEFVNGVEDLSKVGFGIIPAGVANDFTKVISLPRKIDEAVENILNKKVHKYDYIDVSGHKVVNVVSCGADVAIVETLNGYKNKNKLNHMRAVMKNMFSYSFSRADIISEQYTAKEKEFFLFAFCNGKYWDNGRIINPHCNLEDEYANMLIVSPMPNGAKFKLFRNIQKGKHIYMDNVEEYWTSSVQLKAHSPIKLNCDGKILEFTNPKISLVRDGLNIYNEEKIYTDIVREPKTEQPKQQEEVMLADKKSKKNK